MLEKSKGGEAGTHVEHLHRGQGIRRVSLVGSGPTEREIRKEQKGVDPHGGWGKSSLYSPSGCTVGKSTIEREGRGTMNWWFPKGRTPHINGGKLLLSSSCQRVGGRRSGKGT